MILIIIILQINYKIERRVCSSYFNVYAEQREGKRITSGIV
jgi:hypothetical protein